MRVDFFDYELPRELIAQHPVRPRDASRLLALDRAAGRFEHRAFLDLPQLMQPGDCLVFNDTKVLPARLLGTRAKTGGKWEGLFLRESGAHWEMMTQTRGSPSAGERIDIDEGRLVLELVQKTETGTWLVKPLSSQCTWKLLESAGHVPLPPYIRGGHDTPEDADDYQTIFAERCGAVAAPTAGLHFTQRVLDALAERGVEHVRVTLHVGPGTFQPVHVDDISEHVMHTEWCELSADAAQRLESVRQRGHRVIAVGTTSVRVLETAAAMDGTLAPFCGQTHLFIAPGYTFRVVDALLTNFHLPRSTLLMLVCAFAGLDPALAAYREAVRERYRFYSYGDAMLVV